MEARKPSESAIAAAMIRASHLILDDNPKILQDTLAWKFSGVVHLSPDKLSNSALRTARFIMTIVSEQSQ
jgi:hypothetical protein